MFLEREGEREGGRGGREREREGERERKRDSKENIWYYSNVYPMFIIGICF